MILSYVYIDTKNMSRADIVRKQSEAARALLFEMLEYYGVRERAISRDDHNRPYLVGRSDIDFNISHSGDIALCVLSVGEGRVGVDVEKTESALPFEHLDRFSKRFFAPSEKISEKNLFRKWTEKEAYIKYVGVGLSSGIRDADPSSDPLVRIENLTVGDYTVAVCLGKNEGLSVIYPFPPETGRREAEG